MTPTPTATLFYNTERILVPSELAESLLEFRRTKKDGEIVLRLKDGGICGVKDGRVWK